MRVLAWGLMIFGGFAAIGAIANIPELEGGAGEAFLPAAVGALSAFGGYRLRQQAIAKSNARSEEPPGAQQARPQAAPASQAAPQREPQAPATPEATESLGPFRPTLLHRQVDDVERYGRGFRIGAPDPALEGNTVPVKRNDLRLDVTGNEVVSAAGAGKWYPDALASREATPGRPVTLQRDPSNDTDPNAVKILTESGEQLGWVPAQVAPRVAEAMDQGQELRALILREHITGGQRTGVNVLLGVAGLMPDPPPWTAEHVGSGWYALPNGEKVRGKDEADERMRELASIEPSGE